MALGFVFVKVVSIECSKSRDDDDIRLIVLHKYHMVVSINYGTHLDCRVHLLQFQLMPNRVTISTISMIFSYDFLIATKLVSLEPVNLMNFSQFMFLLNF